MIIHYLVRGQYPRVWCGARDASLTLIPDLVTCPACLARGIKR